MPGFFAGSKLDQSKAPVSLIPKCGACGLSKLCQSPKMEPTGKGKRKVLIVGEAPGAEEDKQGVQFVGESGKVLRRVLRKIGVDPKHDCWMTNAIICRPPNNRTPGKEIDYCLPNLIKTIKELDPEIIIPLGGVAVKSLIGHLWKEDVGSITRWAGFQIPSKKPNAWICPTFHPSFVLRAEKKEMFIPTMFFEEHLEKAFALTGRPWKEIVDYKKQVKRIYDPTEAAKELRLMSCFNTPMAFDYETNMKKPDRKTSLIVSASVSDGSTTIAFPMAGEAIPAMKQFLESPVPKIASNLKFETRWSLKFFGVPPRNWLWDTMLGSHWMDNRSGITSIKFQAFVNLGEDSYDDHIKPYLKSAKGKHINRILQEIDLDDLLLYNGIDSLLEYKVAYRQMKATGYPMPKGMCE